MPKKNDVKDQIIDPNVLKYTRGDIDINFHKKINKKVSKNLRKRIVETHEQILDAAETTAAAEVLLPEDRGYIEVDEGEKVYKLSQKRILSEVDGNVAKNMLDLKLIESGPYKMKYSRNGRYMIFCGQKGHVATMDCLRSKVGTELQLDNETIHDVQYLHNESLFAVAQNKFTYIYDNSGMEIHCMRKHERPYRLDFLPYHFLLTTIGHSGWIKWHDVSTGDYVAGYSTGHGPCKVLKHNPQNAVSFAGHTNGVVSLWSPASGKALVSMLTHKAPVSDIAIDREGRYMTTCSLDGYMKVWDLRKYQCLHAYKTDKPVTALDISETGLVGMSVGRTIQVLKDCFTKPTDVTYLKHEIKGLAGSGSRMSGVNAVATQRALASSVSISSLRFRPYEDILGCGHSHGIMTMLVPGSGEPNFDTYEANPFQNKKQRRESEIQGLLYKLQPSMISLDSSFIGGVDKDVKTLQKEQDELLKSANSNEFKKDSKNRKRGRNKISKRLKRKQKNVIDENQLKLKAQLEEQKEKREKKVQEKIKEAKKKKRREESGQDSNDYNNYDNDNDNDDIPNDYETFSALRRFGNSRAAARQKEQRSQIH